MADQEDLRDEETKGSATCGLVALPRDQEATSSSKSEELARKQRQPLICMARPSQPTTLKERELLKSELAQLQVLDLMEQEEPLQNSVEELVKAGMFTP